MAYGTHAAGACRGRFFAPHLAAIPLAYGIVGSAIGREIADWLREFHGRGNLIPVPEGIQQAAKGLACQFAVVGFMKTAPERTIRLATQVIPVVQSTSTSPPDEPLVLPDSRSATSRALFLGLEQIFLGRDLHPQDPHEAVASALKSLREAIPYDKLSRAFRDPQSSPRVSRVPLASSRRPLAEAAIRRVSRLSRPDHRSRKPWFRRKDSNLRKRNQKAHDEESAPESAACRREERDGAEPDGTTGNPAASSERGDPIPIHGRNTMAIHDRETELRRTAAAALGLLSVGDVDGAADVLRAFLQHA